MQNSKPQTEFDCEDFERHWVSVMDAATVQSSIPIDFAPSMPYHREGADQPPSNKRFSAARFTVPQANPSQRTVSQFSLASRLLWIIWGLAISLLGLAFAKTSGTQVYPASTSLLVAVICWMNVALMGRVLGTIPAWHLPMFGVAWGLVQINAESLACVGWCGKMQAEQSLLLLLGCVWGMAKFVGLPCFMSSGRRETIGVTSSTKCSTLKCTPLKCSPLKCTIAEILSLTLFVALWISLQAEASHSQEGMFHHHPLAWFQLAVGIQLAIVVGWLMESTHASARFGRIASLLLPLASLWLSFESPSTFLERLSLTGAVGLAMVTYYAMLWSTTAEPEIPAKVEPLPGVSTPIVSIQALGMESKLQTF